MAGENSLRPSEATCLVKSLTAHDTLLILVSTSSTRDLKLLAFSSEASNPAINPYPTYVPSAEMLDPLNRTSIQPDRRVNHPLPPSEKLGFLLVGFSILSPLRVWSPLTKGVSQILHPRILRFDRNLNLSHSRQPLCRFMEPYVRRLHLDSKLPLLLVWLKTPLDNLLLESPRDLPYEVSNWNELDIMIQTIWRCDYRCIFRPSSLSSCMLLDTLKLQCINLLKYPTKNLKSSGIMTPSPWSGCYHFSYQSSTPKHNISRNVTTIRATAYRIPAKAMLMLLPLSLESSLAVIHLSTSQSRMTVTTLSTLGFFDVDRSCNNDLTCLSLLLSGCLTALLDYCLMFYIFFYDFGEIIPL